MSNNSRVHPEAARSLGKRLRDVRKDVGVSQEELSHLVGMHVSNVGKIERGQANPRIDTIIRLAAALEVSVASLTSEITVDDLPPTERPFSAREYVDERRRRTGR